MKRIKITKEQLVLRYFLQNSRPYHLDVSDAFNEAGKDCYLPPKDLDGTLDSVLTKFEARAIIASGLVVEASDGDLQWSPELSSPEEPMIALCIDARTTPDCLLTTNGILASDEIPMKVMLKDRKTIQRLEKQHGFLFLCAGTEHAASLRNCGFAAVQAGGLLDLQSTGLQDLANAVNTARPLKKHTPNGKQEQGAKSTEGNLGRVVDGSIGSESSPGSDEGITARLRMSGNHEGVDDLKASRGGRTAATYSRVTIVLACWHPRQFTEAHYAYMRCLAEFLAKAQRVLGIDFTDVTVWCPTPAESEEFEFVLRHGDPDCLRLLVCESIESSNVSPAVFATQELDTRQPIDSYAAAMRAIQQLDIYDLAGSKNDASWASAAAEYMKFSQRDLIDPLMKLAMEQDDPKLRLQLALAVEECGLLCAQTPALLRQLRECGISEDDQGNTPAVFRSIDQRLRISDSIFKKLKNVK